VRFFIASGVAVQLELRRLLIITQVLFAVLAAVLWVAALLGHATIGLLVGVGVTSDLVSVVDHLTVSAVSVTPTHTARAAASPARTSAGVVR
jgi:hypothetical protein